MNYHVSICGQELGSLACSQIWPAASWLEPHDLTYILTSPLIVKFQRQQFLEAEIEQKVERKSEENQIKAK
jgi:hypothetical protein